MDFRQLKTLNIPEGVVIRIATPDGLILWQKRGVEPDIPDLPTPNGYEIYYTSTDGNIVKLSTLYNGVKPISNTYENGIGRMLFEKELTEIGQEMFDSCYTLQTIILPNSITTIVRWAFYRCVNLINITLPNSVTNIGNAVFNICNSLNQITSLNPIAPTLDENVFFDLPEVGTLYIPEGAEGYDVWLEQLPDGWSIQYIVPVIPNNEIWYTSTDGKIVKPTISPTDNTLISNTYENGKGVIVFENDLTEMNMFSYRETLSEIRIPNSITTISDYGFSGCSSLQSIVIPDSVTSIGKRAFNQCTSLQNIDLSNSITTISDSTFYNCTSLTEITIPNSVTTIEDSAFYNCTSLTSITIPDSVTNIGEFTFVYCTSLTSITIPNSVTTITTAIFQKCDSLTSITIPDSVTKIEGFAFNGCTSLTSITIPDSVTVIGTAAFIMCSSLSEITSLNPIAPTLIDDSVFHQLPEVGTLYIPEGAEGYDVWLEQLPDWKIEYITE